MEIKDIKTESPFNDLFGIDEKILQAITENIREKGYDYGKPIVLWAGKNLVVDGHTRLKAARLAGLEEIPACTIRFGNVNEALAYSIHHQRNRRNLTQTEILRCIEKVDQLKERGGDRKSEEAKSKMPHGTIDRSAETTAKVVGVSPRTVARARTVLSDPEEKAAVLQGKKSINRASQDAQVKRKTPTPTEPVTTKEDKRQDVLLQAWGELKAWRKQYKDYAEFESVFRAIDHLIVKL